MGSEDPEQNLNYSELQLICKIQLKKQSRGSQEISCNQEGCHRIQISWEDTIHKLNI